MPLGAEYDKLIDSKIADMKNIGGRHGGAITAAQFLQRFVNDMPWAHLDIAGTAMGSPATEINQSWGFGLRRAAARPAGSRPLRRLKLMAEVLFYHLTESTLEEALPGLIEKSLERGWKAVVQAGTEERRDALDRICGPIATIPFSRMPPIASAPGRPTGPADRPARATAMAPRSALWSTALHPPTFSRLPARRLPVRRP